MQEKVTYGVNHNGHGKYHLMYDMEPLCKTKALILFTKTSDVEIEDGKFYEVYESPAIKTEHNYKYFNDYCKACLKKALKK